MAEDPHSDDRGERRPERRRASPGAAAGADRSLDDILESIRRLTGDAAADAAGRSRPAGRGYAVEDALGFDSWAQPAPEIADEVASLTEAMLAAEEARRDATEAKARRAALAARWRVQAQEAGRPEALRSGDADALAIAPPRFTPIAPIARRQPNAAPPPDPEPSVDAEPLAADGGWPALERIKRRAAEALGHAAASATAAPASSAAASAPALAPVEAAPSRAKAFEASWLEAAPEDERGAEPGMAAEPAEDASDDPLARLQKFLRADPLDAIRFEPDAPAADQPTEASRAGFAPREASALSDPQTDDFEADERADDALGVDPLEADDLEADDVEADDRDADPLEAGDLKGGGLVAEDVDADDLEASVFEPLTPSRADPAHWRRDDPREGPQDDDLRRLEQVRALMRKTIRERRNRPKRPPALPSEAIRALIGLETPGLDAGALTAAAPMKPAIKRAPTPQPQPQPSAQAPAAVVTPPIAPKQDAAPEPQSALTPEVEALLKSHLRALVGDVLREELSRLRGPDAQKPPSAPTKPG